MSRFWRPAKSDIIWQGQLSLCPTMTRTSQSITCSHCHIAGHLIIWDDTRGPIHGTPVSVGRRKVCDRVKTWKIFMYSRGRLKHTKKRFWQSPAASRARIVRVRWLSIHRLATSPIWNEKYKNYREKRKKNERMKCHLWKKCPMWCQADIESQRIFHCHCDLPRHS